MGNIQTGEETMFRWIKDIIDGIKWARRKMLSDREEMAFQRRISWFLSGTIWPEALKYKKEHGHLPKYLLLPMSRLADLHRIMEVRKMNVRGADDNKVFDIELVWDGKEGDEGWSFSDECPYEGE